MNPAKIFFQLVALVPIQLLAGNRILVNELN
jgi:hypothetical protein